jgi:hypothetical protein
MTWPPSSVSPGCSDDKVDVAVGLNRRSNVILVTSSFAPEVLEALAIAAPLPVTEQSFVAWLPTLVS